MHTYTKSFIQVFIAFVIYYFCKCLFTIGKKSGTNPNFHQLMNVEIEYNKKEWSTVTCYNVDEPWKNTKWKRPDTKDDILYHLIYMNKQI
jgi:hypothetical protein